MYCHAGGALFLLFGFLLAVIHSLENTTEHTMALKPPPQAAAVHSHFEDCPDSHSQFCLQGACRFLVQEKMPACVCPPGFMGSRCEHADLLAVVAADQKQQTIASVLVGGVVGSVLLILLCVLLHCCEKRGPCVCGRPHSCRNEKPDSLLKSRASCCHPETV